MYICGFLASFFVKPFSSAIGKKWNYFFGCAVGIIAFAWLFFGRGSSFSTIQIYGVCALLGISTTIILVTSLGLTNDLISHNTSSAAFVFGAMSLLDKVSNGIAVMLVQTLHGHHEDKAEFYRNVLAWIGGGSIGLAMLALLLLSGDDLTSFRRRSVLGVNSAIEEIPESEERTSEEEEEEQIRRPLLAKAT